jgi:REP element-mobilizing transposase RayT
MMARKARRWHENACYHVMGRGNRRTAIFKSDEDNMVFLVQLAAVKQKHPFDLHACCLMTNHFHLELTTRKEPIWKIVKPVMQNYAMWFNQRYGYVGHVFDSRYTSCMIEDDRYFLEVSRYIHLNPVKAQMARSALDYKHSSYALFVLRRPMEDKRVTISRVNGTNPYPANFVFVEAMNPCPCGYYPSKRCRCADYEIIHYRGKISGLILERIDIQKSVAHVDYFELNDQKRCLSSAQFREKVKNARKLQQEI